MTSDPDEPPLPPSSPAPPSSPSPTLSPDSNLAQIAERTAMAKSAIAWLRMVAQGINFDAEYARNSLEQLEAAATTPAELKPEERLLEQIASATATARDAIGLLRLLANGIGFHADYARSSLELLAAEATPRPAPPAPPPPPPSAGRN